MKTTYHTPNSLVKPPSKLECLIIRNYSTKYHRVFKVLKEFLDGTPNITKYCRIKQEPSRYISLSLWELYRVKPDNIYVFTHDTDYSRFISLLRKRLFKQHGILCNYIITPTFYLKSYDYPLEYSSSYGTLLMDKENVNLIME